MTNGATSHGNNDNGEIGIFDLFEVSELQKIQDLFSNATGVASIITFPDGKPITRPSNFSRFCQSIVRGTPKGLANCIRSDCEFGQKRLSGPAIQPCLSSGLWDACANIMVDGKLVAIWMIGQIKNEETEQEKLLAYADEIGAKHEAYLEAYNEVKTISTEQFRKITELLQEIADQLSDRAFRNKKLELLLVEHQDFSLKLKESEEKYRLLVENQNDIVVKVDHLNRFTYVSPSYCRLFGQTEEQLLGQSFFPMVHPDDIESTKRGMQQLVVPPHSCKVVQRAQTVFGWRWISWSDHATLDRNGKIESVIGVGRDITKRREAERLLEESEKRYRNLVENSILGVFQIQPNGDFKFVNKALLRMLEIDSQNQNKEFKSNSFLKDPAIFDQISSIIRQQGYIENFEVDVLTPAGTEKTLLMSANLIEGLLQGTIADMTEEKKIKENLTQINQQLMASNAEKDKFFSIIAHDLRNPFNTFLGLTELMADEAENMTLSQLQKLALSMKKTARNVNNLLENLLNWSKSKQGLIPFKPQHIHLTNLISRFGESCFVSARSKSINMKVDFPENIDVFADPDMLHLILRNLVSNAIKFTPEGGTVAVSAFVNQEQEVCFSVRDNGIGMSAELCEKLFKPDSHTSRSGTNGEPSSGLGLILCKEFIDKHQGRIWVESQPEKGSSFFFTIGTMPE